MQCFSRIACVSKVVVAGCLLVLLALQMGAKTPGEIGGVKFWVTADVPASLEYNTNMDENPLLTPVYATATALTLAGGPPAALNRVARWKDQTPAPGGSNHLTQLIVTGGAYQPVYVDENGVKSVRIDYWRDIALATSDKSLTVPSSVVTSSQALTGVAVVEMNSVDRQSRIFNIGAADQALDGNPYNMQLMVQDGVLQVWDGAVRRKSAVYVPSSKCVVLWRANESNIFVYVNSVSARAVFPAAPPRSYLGGSLGSAGGGSFNIYEVAWYDRDVGEDGARELLDMLAAKYNVAVAPAKRIIIDGDSLSEGIGATLNHTFWRQLSPQDYFVCHATSGRTIRNGLVKPALKSTRGSLEARPRTGCSASWERTISMACDLETTFALT